MSRTFFAIFSGACCRFAFIENTSRKFPPAFSLIGLCSDVALLWTTVRFAANDGVGVGVVGVGVDVDVVGVGVGVDVGADVDVGVGVGVDVDVDVGVDVGAGIIEFLEG